MLQLQQNLQRLSSDCTYTQTHVNMSAVLCVRTFRNCGHRDRDSPWRCPQSTVLGNNSPLCMGPWQERSRLRASIPDTFPLFPPSIPPNPSPPASQFPPQCTPPASSQLFSPSRHNFFPLFWEQEEQKSRLLVTGRGLLWSLVKIGGKKGKLGRCPGLGLDKGSLCAAAERSEVRRGQVDGWVACSGVRCHLLLVNSPSRVSVYVPHQCLI